MAINKVEYGNSTLIDLTNDTVTSTNLLSGITAHSKTGDKITGTLTLNIFRTGTSEPSNDIGEDGDWYLVVEE